MKVGLCHELRCTAWHCCICGTTIAPRYTAGPGSGVEMPPMIGDMLVCTACFREQTEQPKKKFRVFIHWGGKNARAETPNEIKEYSFDTLLELDSFMQGVDEANGWLDFHQWLEEDLVCEVGDCKEPARPCVCENAHCAKHPHVEETP